MSEASLFAWQGFSLEHPSDWSPVSLTGNRSEGYCRLISSGRVGGQVRWKQARKSPDLNNRLENYLKRLHQDARKRKERFESETEESDGRILYRWTGAGQGRGVLFWDPESRRVFILEVIGGRKDSLLTLSRDLIRSFRVTSGDSEPWSLYGLNVRLPRGLLVEKPTLLTGRTKLTFRARGARIEAERWAFGKELLQKHGFEPWARAVLAMPKAEVVQEEEGLKLTQKSLLAQSQALVRYDEPGNRIVIVRSRTRSPKWRPDWSWLA